MSETQRARIPRFSPLPKCSRSCACSRRTSRCRPWVAKTRQPLRHALRMVGGHIGEHGRQQRVSGTLPLVEEARHSQEPWEAPLHSKIVGVRSGSATGSLNWTYQCMPLQNGLFCEWPHRQSA